MPRCSKEQLRQLNRSIQQIEKLVLERREPAVLRPSSTRCQAWAGYLGLTIALEVGEIRRFDGRDSLPVIAGRWSGRTSNEKNKGRNNRKCGNKYLAWAFVEAANFAKRYDERADVV